MKHPLHYIKTSAIISLSLILFLFSGTGTKAQSTACQAGFTSTVNGATVSFTNTSTGAALPSYMWNFGDGNSSNATNPVHTYSANGTYQVCLFMWDSMSMCQSSFCANIIITGSVNPPCIASFSWYQDSMMPNLINFYDMSQSNPVSWNWSFGDGNFSAQQNPSHTYANPGTYWACLEIKTTTGDSCTFCDSVYVGINPPPNTCTASWTNMTAGMNVNFTNTSTGGNANTGYYWDFGDGNNSSLMNPVHTYSFNGTYTVCLTMFDQMGNCYDQYCDTVTVSGGQNPPCSAMWYAYPDTFLMNGTYYFVDYSSGNPVSWSWNFGDGSPNSTQQNPVHQYTAQGTYWVCLTIITMSNDTCSYCDSVQYKLQVNPNAIAQQNSQLIYNLNNYPNPFSHSTMISYSLAFSQNVQISICDLAGRTIVELANESQSAGNHNMEWAAGDLPSGIYWLKMNAGDETLTRKLVLIK